ncbi:hypothetical protein [Marivirga sp.]|uniref:hypothetical protein n=1 Tax=Marivirga sp. TaxID=2018662 RepID=UPI002D7F77C9|nr:hypothetical protein [Marivirga sp.]HET8859842.1 hypothetical protein [Marivirga sp.]
MEKQSQLKSQRINLGKGNLGLPENTGKRLSYVIAGLFLLSSLFMVFDYLEEGTELIKHILIGGLYFVSGIVFLFRATTKFTETSKVAPHMLISEEGIKIKPGIFNKSQFIGWNEIQKIELGNFKIGLKLNNTTNLIYYS